jgi:hypothetical protein
VEDYLNTQPGTGKDYLSPGRREENTEYKSVQYAMIAQMVAAYIGYIFGTYQRYTIPDFVKHYVFILLNFSQIHMQNLHTR